MLVFMFDRIGRIADETPFVVERFVKNGIRVWSTREANSVMWHHASIRGIICNLTYTGVLRCGESRADAE